MFWNDAFELDNSTYDFNVVYRFFLIFCFITCCILFCAHFLFDFSYICRRQFHIKKTIILSLYFFFFCWFLLFSITFFFVVIQLTTLFSLSISISYKWELISSLPQNCQLQIVYRHRKNKMVMKNDKFVFFSLLLIGK